MPSPDLTSVTRMTAFTEAHPEDKSQVHSHFIQGHFWWTKDFAGLPVAQHNN